MGEHNIRNFSINFGPQHPAAHGVLRLVLELDGEIVERVDPHIGLLHRGTEKLIEYKTYTQAIALFRPARLRRADEPGARLLPRDREAARHHGAAPRRSSSACSILEIGRILSHLLNVTTQAMDVGALTPPLWGFEEREKLMIFYERASGSRMHANYVRPGGVAMDLPPAAHRRHRGLLRSVPEGRRRSRHPRHRQPHLQAAQRRYRRGVARGVLEMGLLRRHGARLGRRLGPAQVAALRVLRGNGLRHPGRARTATTTIVRSSAWKRCARAFAS